MVQLEHYESDLDVQSSQGRWRYPLSIHHADLPKIGPVGVVDKVVKSVSFSYF
jgi:hypothetical protein